MKTSRGAQRTQSAALLYVSQCCTKPNLLTYEYIFQGQPCTIKSKICGSNSCENSIYASIICFVDMKREREDYHTFNQKG